MFCHPPSITSNFFYLFFLLFLLFILVNIFHITRTLLMQKNKFYHITVYTHYLDFSLIFYRTIVVLANEFHI